jgi:integrase/recombinase XerD
MSNALSPDLPPIRLISLESSSVHTTSAPTDDRCLQVDSFLRTKSFKSNTQKAYRYELNRFLHWTNQNWVDITPRHIAQFKKHLLAQGFAPASVNRTLTALKSFFKWLEDTELSQFHTNPATVVGRTQIQPRGAKNLSEDNLNALFAAAAQREMTALRDTAILAVLLHQLSGTEICYLNINNYDGKYLKIHRPQYSSPKVIPLSPSACQSIDKYLTQRHEETQEIIGEQPLFLSKKNQNAQRLGYQAIYYIVKVIGQSAGIQDLTPQALKRFGKNSFPL